LRTLIFYHLPKTGGSSVVRMLQQRLPRFFELAGSHEISRHMQLEELCRCQESTPQLIAGHMQTNIHKLLPSGVDYDYVTVLRPAVDRALSHYAWVLKSPNVAKRYLGKDGEFLKLEEIMEMPPWRFWDLRNRCVKMLSGRELWSDADSRDLDRAWETLRTMHVGFLENLRTLMDWIVGRYELMPVNDMPHLKKTNSRRVLGNQLTDDVLTWLEDANELDTRLYARAMSEAKDGMCHPSIECFASS